MPVSTATALTVGRASGLAFADVFPYAGPKEWIEESGISAEQARLRERVYRAARWRAKQLIAHQYAPRIRHYYEKTIASHASDQLKAQELRQEYAVLQPYLGQDDGRRDEQSHFGPLMAVTFRILQSMGKHRGLPESQQGIVKGKTDYRVEDVECAGERVPCLAQMGEPEQPRVAAGYTPPTTPPPPGTAEYADAKARLVALLDENAWLTAFGGYMGIVPQGQFKAGYLPRSSPSTGARGEPKGLTEERTFDWATRYMAATNPPLDKAGLLAGGFKKRDTANQLIAIGEDIEEWARTGEFPRLEDLRHLTYPGVELYRRTYLSPPQAAEDLKRSHAAAFFVKGQETIRVMEASKALEVASCVESELRLALTRAAGPEAARAVRIASTGRLRQGRAGKHPVSWLTYVLYNDRPSLFTAPGEPRYQMIVRMAALASATSQGWQVSFGREHIDVVAEGLRISYAEAPEANNIGTFQLFATGPVAYVESMRHRAMENGLLLNVFGLFHATGNPTDILRGQPHLQHVPSTLGAIDFSSSDWHLQGERRIFNALGLVYQTPAERLAGAMPKNA